MDEQTLYRLRRQVGVSVYAGLLLSALGAIAWWSGQPFVFPSLGPTAFVLAFERPDERRRSRRYRIVGGHVVGACAGVLAWALLNGSVPITAAPPAGSLAGLRLASGAVCSLVLTSFCMTATNTVHPPACATTLIVSLGILTTPPQIGIIVTSVVVLVGLHANVRPVFDRIVEDVQPHGF